MIPTASLRLIDLSHADELVPIGTPDRRVARLGGGERPEPAFGATCVGRPRCGSRYCAADLWKSSSWRISSCPFAGATRGGSKSAALSVPDDQIRTGVKIRELAEARADGHMAVGEAARHAEQSGVADGHSWMWPQRSVKLRRVVESGKLRAYSPGDVLARTPASTRKFRTASQVFASAAHSRCASSSDIRSPGASRKACCRVTTKF
jgi:hypothetical protein